MLANRYLLTHQEKHLRETFVFLDSGIDRKIWIPDLEGYPIISPKMDQLYIVMFLIINKYNIHIYRYIHTNVYTLEVNHDSKLVLPFG